MIVEVKFMRKSMINFIDFFFTFLFCIFVNEKFEEIINILNKKENES